MTAPETGTPPEAVTHREIAVGETLTNIQFERQEKPDGSVVFKSSERDRKIIFLETGVDFEPQSGVDYTVEVITDTNPSKSKKGKLIVRITEEDGVPIEVRKKKVDDGIPSVIEIDRDAGKVYILDTEVAINPERGKLVPVAEEFKYFTLDEETLDTLVKLAKAFNNGDPFLIEGETAASKTSSIEYFAMLTNNEVRRINLNGQTDTSELIGKYVPSDGSLQINFEQALGDPDLLEPQSVAILEKANREGRGLNLLESQKIASLEKIEVAEWRWQDGIIPDAMKKGQFVILDEGNLAEQMVAERTNPVLEKPPSLVLSEGSGELIGEGGEFEVDPHFWMTLTMNPAEYAGRKAMSPAYKDRWLAQKQAKTPDDKSYIAMFDLMVFGEQPDIYENPEERDPKKRRLMYRGDKIEPKHPVLNKIPGMREALGKLALFQHKLEKQCKSRAIGKGRKEPYIFTRRGLMSFLEYMENTEIVDRKAKKRITVANDPKRIFDAIKFYFLDKIADADDLANVKAELAIAAVGTAVDKLKPIKK